MLFLKEHLVNDHYTWPDTKTDVNHMKEPSRRLFDRANGNHILYIINYFGQSIGKQSISSGRRIEELILNQLPADSKSEVTVFNWLRGVYLFYAH
jgi:hypothetical protein